jgi:phosphoribosylformylglycinamidine cyclo-ligase
VGFDLVAMCVDDLAVVGARPLGFVDYLAVGGLDGDRDARIVGSIARACAEVGAALLGGETAEHPGVMEPDGVDLAGAALGVVEKGAEITGAAVRPGDVVVGLESPNLRSNGFSLVRRVFAGADLEEDVEGRSLADLLLEPSVLYAPAALAATFTGAVHGMAHITGGGIPGNLIRPLPEGCGARIDRSSWRRPAVFDLVQERGNLDDDAMVETFNLGIGFCIIAPPDAVEAVKAAVAPHPASVIGEIVAGDRSVWLS